MIAKRYSRVFPNRPEELKSPSRSCLQPCWEPVSLAWESPGFEMKDQMKQAAPFIPVRKKQKSPGEVGVASACPEEPGLPLCTMGNGYHGKSFLGLDKYHES